MYEKTLNWPVVYEKTVNWPQLTSYVRKNSQLTSYVCAPSLSVTINYTGRIIKQM